MVTGYMRSLAKQIAAFAGLQVRQLPSCILRDPSRELSFSLEMVAAPIARKSPSFTFIQVGAHDGSSNDPIREMIHAYGWRGVLIEPQKELFDRLVESYQSCPQLKFENVAVADEDGVRTLYRVPPGTPGVPDWASQLASFDLKTVRFHKKWIPNIDNLIEEVPVKCLSIKTIAERNGLDDVGLVQIDAEGYDFEIVKSIPFEVMKPKIVAFEHAHLSKADFNKCCQLLVQRGYRIAVGDVDTFAVSACD
jgi:FkbM family methyltransferase